MPERVSEALQVLLGCKTCQPVLNWSLPSRLSQTCICHDGLIIDIFYYPKPHDWADAQGPKPFSCLPGASQTVPLVLSCLPGASQALQMVLACLPGACLVLVPPRLSK